MTHAEAETLVKDTALTAAEAEAYVAVFATLQAQPAKELLNLYPILLRFVTDAICAEAHTQPRPVRAVYVEEELATFTAMLYAMVYADCLVEGLLTEDEVP